MNTITLHQRVSVPLHYPVHFTRDLFAADQELLARTLHGEGGRVMVLLDQGVDGAFPDLKDRISAWFDARSAQFHLLRPPQVLPGGEAVKNDYRGLMHLLDSFLEYHLCRHSYVLAIGGGALLDAAGFAAALVHRGLRLVRLPSTTLAQNDAGIGVKNGMNLHGGKNTVGTFAAPFAVLNDFSLLTGLSDEHWIGGVSEAFKVAMIKDADFFEELCTLAPRLRRREMDAMERVIVRCAALHLDHIAGGGDPFEQGSARPLDFGHWSAHKLEALSGYRVGHGQAVAIGIALDTFIAARLGWVEEELYQRLCRALTTCGFRLWEPEMAQREGDGRLSLLRGLEEFQEHLGGVLTLSLPKGLGCTGHLHALEPALVEAGLASLRDFASCCP